MGPLPSVSLWSGAESVVVQGRAAGPDLVWPGGAAWSPHDGLEGIVETATVAMFLAWRGRPDGAGRTFVTGVLLVLLSLPATPALLVSRPQHSTEHSTELVASESVESMPQRLKTFRPGKLPKIRALRSAVAVSSQVRGDDLPGIAPAAGRSLLLAEREP